MARSRTLFLVTALLLACAGTFATEEEDKIILRSVDRTIDLQSQLTKITSKIVLENDGKGPLKYYYHAIEPGQKLSFIAAHSREPGRSDLPITKKKLPAHPGIEFYAIELSDPLLPGRTTTIAVETVATHQLEPHPKEITQKEKQLVKYTGNLYAYSTFNSFKQSTVVTLPSKSIESYTKVKPVSQSDSTITYGPYENVKPFASEKLQVHFENNNKFLTVVQMERVIELSHWGNIAVEENIEIVHTGAKLKGAFSRYEYARESKSGQASVQSFDTVLPAAASDIYYRDDIGNISTSHTRVKKDSVEVNLRPRFPLFGGWKTKYTIGYNVPSYEYLYHNGDSYVLDMRLLDHVFDDMVVDELLVKVILPEGSSNIKLTLPYEAQRLKDSLHYTYLDTTGRPVISIVKKNLVENHIQNFRLSYTFPRVLMLQEPLLVAVALYLLFLLVIVYVRLDFSIDKDEASETKLRIAGQCEKILAAQDRRVSSYNELDEQFAYLKANKDTNGFLSAVKSINQEYKNATTAVANLGQKLKSESNEVYERIQELQKADRNLKELYNQLQALYVDKLVPGKIGRQQFVEAEAAIVKKKEESIERINVIFKSLQTC